VSSKARISHLEAEARALHTGYEIYRRMLLMVANELLPQLPPYEQRHWGERIVAAALAERPGHPPPRRLAPDGRVW
jgi:hypothetical protein